MSSSLMRDVISIVRRLALPRAATRRRHVLAERPDVYLPWLVELAIHGLAPEGRQSSRCGRHCALLHPRINASRHHPNARSTR